MILKPRPYTGVEVDGDASTDETDNDADADTIESTGRIKYVPFTWACH